MNAIFPIGALISVFYSALAHSQVEDHLFRALDSGSYTSIEVSLSGSSGNLEDEYLSLEVANSHRGDTHSWVASAKINDSETNDQKTNEEETLDLRYLYSFDSSNTVEAIAEYSRDVLEGISGETVFGAGYRWEKVATDENAIDMALGFGVVRNARQNLFSPEERDTRGNIYASLNAPLGDEGANATLSTQVRPNLEEISDWRLESELTLNAPISDRLTVNFQITYKYDAEPELNIESRDLDYSASLMYQF